MLGAMLIFGSLHHHNTASRIENVNGVVAEVLRSFAVERADDWPALVRLLESRSTTQRRPSEPATRLSTSTAASNSPPTDPLCCTRPCGIRRGGCPPDGARDGGGAGPVVRIGARRSATPPGGTCSSLSGTRCCSQSTRPSRRACCSPRGGWAPSGSSRALHQTRAGSTYPRRCASSPSSTSSACAHTSDYLTASAATRMPAHHRSGWPGRRARARGTGPAPVQDALWAAVLTGALDRP